MKFSLFSLSALCALSYADLGDLASSAIEGGVDLISSLKAGAVLVDDTNALARYKARYDGVKVAAAAKFHFTDDDVQHLVDVNAQLIDIIDSISKDWPLWKGAWFATEVNAFSTQAWAELQLLAPRLKGVSCDKINSLISVDSVMDDKYSSIKDANGLEALTILHKNPFKAMPGCAAPTA